MEGSGIIWEKLFCNYPFINQRSTLPLIYFCRGAQKAHRAVPNEALYGVLRISRLITWTYLHLSNFPLHGNRLSLQPDIHFQLHARLPQSALRVYSPGLCFSPFQNAELEMYLINLGFISPFLFTSWTSHGVRRRGLFIIYN